MEEELTLGMLIDGTEENLKEHISNKDLGYVRSLINTLTATYYNMEANKKALMKKVEGREIDTKNNPEDKVILSTIQGILVKMGKIEYFVLLLNEEVNNRSLKE
jgi:hypothetical protein